MQALRREKLDAASSSKNANASEATHDTVDSQTEFYKISDSDVALVVEEDLEDQHHPDSDEPILRTLGDEFEAAEDDEDAITNIPYKKSAEVFMELLSNNTMNTHVDMKNNPIPRPLCVDDDTIEDVTKVSLAPHFDSKRPN